MTAFTKTHPIKAIARYQAESEAIAKRNRALMRAEFRTRIRLAASAFASDPTGLMTWLAQVPPAPAQFYSTIDAVRWLSARVELERSRIRNRDWKANPDRFVALMARLIVARWQARLEQGGGVMAKREDGQLRDVRVPMFMAQADVDAIDDWRVERRIWSRSEAIRRLVEIGLSAERAKAGGSDA